VIRNANGGNLICFVKLVSLCFYKDSDKTQILWMEGNE
jgi:hypothetical protein